MNFLSWKDYVAKFCEQGNYPNEAKEVLLDGIQRIVDDVHLRECFEKQLHNYTISHKFESIAHSVEDIEKQFGNVALHLDTAIFLFFVLCTRHLIQLYDKLAIPKSFFTGLQDDMRSKLMESYEINGIWGTFVAEWYYKFFALEIFAIGRLEYELAQTPACMSTDGKHCFNGEPALMIHIPSTGPLLKEQVQESMKEAATFFKHEFVGGRVLFMCRSWLLFPGHYEMLPENSGIRQFMDEFEIIHVYIDDAKRNLWRIFGTTDTDDFKTLPRNTTLQRAYADWLSAGRPIGNGIGIRYIKVD